MSDITVNDIAVNAIDYQWITIKRVSADFTDNPQEIRLRGVELPDLIYALQRTQERVRAEAPERYKWVAGT